MHLKYTASRCYHWLDPLALLLGPLLKPRRKLSSSLQGGRVFFGCLKAKLQFVYSVLVLLADGGGGGLDYDKCVVLSRAMDLTSTTRSFNRFLRYPLGSL
jgi:hypothetical protein